MFWSCMLSLLNTTSRNLMQTSVLTLSMLLATSRTHYLAHLTLFSFKPLCLLLLTWCRPACWHRQCSWRKSRTLSLALLLLLVLVLVLLLLIFTPSNLPVSCVSVSLSPDASQRVDTVNVHGARAAHALAAAATERQRRVLLVLDLDQCVQHHGRAPVWVGKIQRIKALSDLDFIVTAIIEGMSQCEDVNKSEKKKQKKQKEKKKKKEDAATAQQDPARHRFLFSN